MKKLLSLILAICLLLGVAPVTLSEEAQPEEEVAVTAAAPEAEADTSDPAEAPDPEPAPAPAEAEPAPAPAEAEPAPAPAAEEKEEAEPAPAPAEEEKEEAEPASAPAEEEQEEAEEEKNEISDPEPEVSDGEPALVSNDEGPYRLTDIVFTSPQPDGVTLEWDAANGPDGLADDYEVCWATTSDYNKAKANGQHWSGGSLSYTVTGLKCGTTYYFFVRGVYLNGDGQPRGWAKTYMKAHTPAPAAPGGFMFVLAPDSAVKLVFTWNQEPSADGYKVFRVENGVESTTPAFTLTSNPLTPSKKWGNITPAEELTFRIYSYKVVSGKQIPSSDYGEYTMVYHIPAPNDLKADSLGRDSVRLSWKAVEGATMYVVERDDGDGEYNIVASQTGTTFTDTGLTFGKKYTYYVTAWIGDTEGLTTPGVAGKATGVAPANLKAVNSDDENFNTITWNAVPQVDGYDLWWTESYDPANPEPEPIQWNEVDAGSNLTYQHSSLTLGQEYTYRVRAYVDCDGNIVYSPWSTAATVIARPPRPQNLTLTNLSYTEQKAEWDAVPDVDGYELQISTNNTFTKLVHTEDITSGTDTDFQTTDPSPAVKIANGTKYYYRVRGYVDTGKKVYGPYSATKSLTSAPEAPASVWPDYTAGINTVKVWWTLVAGATDYNIYSKENDGSWVLVTTVKATTETTQSYTIKNLKVGSIYSFAVSSVRTSGGKTAVGQKEICGPVDLDIKDFIPTDLKYKVVTRTKITLSWKKVNGISLYAVTGECAEDPEFKDSFGEKEASTNSLTISGLKTGYNYTFTVTSKLVVDNAATYSDPAILYDVIPTPLAPATLTATADQTKYGVNLSWTKSAGATGYIIEYAFAQDAPDSAWTQVAQIANPDELTYKHTAAMDESVAGKAYFYRIRSYIDHGGEQKSEPTAAVKVLIKVPKPVLTIDPTGKNEIEVDVKNTADISVFMPGSARYYVYRSTKKDSGFKLVDDIAETDLPYKDTNIKFGTVYYYKFVAVQVNGDGVEVKSAASAVVSGQGKLQPVTGVYVVAEHGGSVEIGWNPLTEATGYNVYYKAEGGSWTLAGSVGKTVYKKRVTGLNPKSQYSFRVAGTAKAGTKTIVGKFDPLEVVTGITKMEPVTGVQVAAVDCTSVKVTWTKTLDATSYQVYIEDPNNAGVWTRKATVSGNSATIKGLGENKSYNFKVRAIIKRNNITDTGDFSSDEPGYTAPAKVTGLKAGTIMTQKVILKWTKSTGADGYIIEWIGPLDNWGDNTPKIVGNTASAVIDSLTADTQYRFRITPFGYEDSTMLEGPVSAVLKVRTAK